MEGRPGFSFCTIFIALMKLPGGCVSFSGCLCSVGSVRRWRGFDAGEGDEGCVWFFWGVGMQVSGIGFFDIESFVSLYRDMFFCTIGIV